MSTIVVIEDNVQNARMAAKLLRHVGHKVLTAEDGEMGLMTVFENQPDLVLIDLGLPDIDGQTVIALIRQQEALQNTPLIAFTAWPEGTAHSMARAYGCDGVITKPIDTRAFAHQVMAFITQGVLGSADPVPATPTTQKDTPASPPQTSTAPTHNLESAQSESDASLNGSGKTNGPPAESSI